MQPIKHTRLGRLGEYLARLCRIDERGGRIIYDQPHGSAIISDIAVWTQDMATCTRSRFPDADIQVVQSSASLSGFSVVVRLADDRQRPAAASPSATGEGPLMVRMAHATRCAWARACDTANTSHGVGLLIAALIVYVALGVVEHIGGSTAAAAASQLHAEL